MTTFAPVTTLEDLDSLDDDEVTAGYSETERGDPEPGENRGRAYWHGWRVKMMDLGEIEIPDYHRRLVHESVSSGHFQRRMEAIRKRFEKDAA